ncbi:type II secretion system F family protein [Halobaculum marinum]|uniref:Type II secretion system F family protein n=1 Tax=Halobaculum marinum TaxID=3031996 RepID=A0ABD5WZL2_9EURY|nr:type II secretion system F family protein [Halobaculum sp. DT55]
MSDLALGEDGARVGRSSGTSADASTAESSEAANGLSVLDRALYALFSRHADSRRHATDRKRYRGAAMATSFDVYVARTYGLSWVVCLGVLAWTLVVGSALPAASLDRVVAPAVALGVPLPSPSRLHVAALAAGVAGTVAKYGTVRLAGARLRWRTAARRSDIERTLPGAARYLHALSSGSDGPRAMLRRVADNDAYGETAVSVRTALTTAALTGSLNEGIGRVARDTPSRDALAPFLLKFREHAAQGGDALSGYLRLESRMLGRRSEQARERNADVMELVAELFVVLLVLPALFVIVLTVMSVLAPGLSAEVVTPFGTTTKRAVAVYGAAAFVLVVGAVAAVVVSDLRPAAQRASYALPRDPAALLRSVASNPASAAVVASPLGALALGGLLAAGVGHANAVLLGYAAFAVPVGLVDLRRGRIDDAKDREISDFVHAVAGHVALGRPLSEAVDRVARDVDLGPLSGDVADLAFALGLASRQEGDLRTGALERFVDRVGTPLAAQTVGLVSGALDAGSDAEAVFETLQAEVGRLYHEKRALRANMFVYVAVGWTTALLVVGIVVAVNLTVLDGFADLASLSTSGGTLDPTAVDPERDRRRFYVVAQATVFASGLFAGAADRGGYAMLLHSGALVTVCYTVFAVAGLL